ncbi:FCD domain-containing protein [Pseudoroseomonas wenyumeiae]|uniref:FCD domain-containing protein n=1 Tax=Teichococcus wenyumeiae TaxID=2478470 RepID=A0A3A9JNQ2_9PROT|nr:FCD domain-containing protein [Pseudoroseomonas wenyumeiae]RKK06155.1 FadR family transcriptional regulator [Pseudoroseomonas wenyumeiae]RMI19757.1 FCD domain-containing protein [Pseudoroseomonas wenyumeiae]
MSARRATDRLEAYLREAGLTPGDRLLPERQLTTLLGVSRRALREALGEMELRDRIWRGVGQGTFIGPKPAGLARPEPRVRASTPLAIMEARLTLEPALAALAAMKATAEDVEAMARAARRGTETRDQDSWGLWDGAFHGAIARACHNPLLLAAFQEVEASRALTDWGRLRAAITTAPIRQASALEHQAISTAIAARDATAAQRAMRAHLQSVYLAIQSEGAGWDDTPEPRDQHAGNHANTDATTKRASTRRTTSP